MKHLRTAVHPNVDLKKSVIIERIATRAIVLQGEEILLLYTQRYNDYSLPGGGVENGEEIEAATIRELSEETGAQGVKIVANFGVYEEFNPHYNDVDTVIHQISHCFFCEIGGVLLEPKLESYEEANGMKAIWINIMDAIEHNENTFANDPKAGFSLGRELYLLKKIAEELSLV